MHRTLPATDAMPVISFFHFLPVVEFQGLYLSGTENREAMTRYLLIVVVIAVFALFYPYRDLYVRENPFDED